MLKHSWTICYGGIYKCLTNPCFLFAAQNWGAAGTSAAAAIDAVKAYSRDERILDATAIDAVKAYAGVD
jgi:hypothetical protein